jgi:ABC-type phosphate transport system substrate-binding protein
MLSFKQRLVMTLLAASIGFVGTANASVTGAGSTFVYPVLSKWAAKYRTMGGDQVNYQSIGSGGGIAQIKAGTVDFGATDKPLTSEELAQAGLLQFPVVIGGVVPVVNIPGMRPGQLKLSGPVLAAIYLRSPSSIGRTDRARPSTSPIILARSARRGRVRSAKELPSNGRSVSAERAMKALLATLSRSPIPSAMSNMRMSSKTRWSMP